MGLTYVEVCWHNPADLDKREGIENLEGKGAFEFPQLMW
jgi:hypothetical protein